MAIFVLEMSWKIIFPWLYKPYYSTLNGMTDMDCFGLCIVL